MPSSAVDHLALADFRPEQYVDCLLGQWMGPMELYRAVRRNAVGLTQITFSGTEDVERALIASAVDSDLAIVLQGVKIRAGLDQYQIRYHFESRHHDGVGGRAVHSAWIERNGTPVLKSVAVITYDTYQDDSEDHEESRSEATYLLGDGELETAVFTSLK